MSKPSDNETKTRRSHGEGTVYKRADGTWIAQITIGRKPDGTQERKTFSGKSEKEVIAKKTEYLFLLKRGELPKVQKDTLGSWMSTWLESYKKHSLRQTSYENYKSLIESHILNDVIARIQIQKLKTDVLQDFLRRMAETGKTVIVREEMVENGKKVTVKKSVKVPLAHRVVNLLLFLIKSALDQSMANNVIVRNPATYCQRYKEPKREKIPLDTEQQVAFLKSLKTHRLYAAFYIALATGVRRGELLALSWSNVNLDEGTIKIDKSLVRVKGGSTFSEPKTESSKRTIRLPNKAIEVLKAHKENQSAEKKKSAERDKKNNISPPTYKDKGLVFCQANGNKIDPRGFQRTFETWREKSGLPKEARLHDLRHTFATMMFNNGADIKTVQSFTGHADTRTLLEVYAHATGESQRVAANKLNDILPDV